MSRVHSIRPIITAPTGYAKEPANASPAFKGLPKFSGGLGIQPEVFELTDSTRKNSSSVPGTKNKLNIWA
jgi:hypothetical protein